MAEAIRDEPSVTVAGPRLISGRLRPAAMRQLPTHIYELWLKHSQPHRRCFVERQLNISKSKSEKCGGSRLSMNAQNAAAQLLCKVVGGVIPQAAKEQGMPV